MADKVDLIEQPMLKRRTLSVAMEDYESACRVITAFEALQALRQLIQYEVTSDSANLTLEQVLASVEVIEYSMLKAVELM